MKAATASILADLLNRFSTLESCRGAIQASYDILEESCEGSGTVLVCGNGGSAADAEHIVGELMKGFLLKRPVPAEGRTAIERKAGAAAPVLIAKLQRGIPAISLVSQTALCTAVANDNGTEMVFAQQVYAYAKPGDVLIALSTSGNAANVLMAASIARVVGAKVIGFTGGSGGSLMPLCDVCICVPAEGAFRVQELHQPVYHALCAMVENELFGS